MQLSVSKNDNKLKLKINRELKSTLGHNYDSFVQKVISACRPLRLDEGDCLDIKIIPDGNGRFNFMGGGDIAEDKQKGASEAISNICNVLIEHLMCGTTEPEVENPHVLALKQQLTEDEVRQLDVSEQYDTLRKLHQLTSFVVDKDTEDGVSKEIKAHANASFGNDPFMHTFFYYLVDTAGLVESKEQERVWSTSALLLTGLRFLLKRKSRKDIFDTLESYDPTALTNLLSLIDCNTGDKKLVGELSYQNMNKDPFLQVRL